MAPSPDSLLCIILVLFQDRSLPGSGDVDLVQVEGHWTLTGHTMFKCFKIPGFDVVWPRAASMPSGKFSGTRVPY